METKYITIPFDIERAKRIINGEEEGKIVTRNGKKARIVCFDAHSDDNIVALIKDEKGVEFAKSYSSDGSIFLKGESDCDLMLSVPEWTTFKDGDIVTMGWEEKPRGRYCKWISIIKSLDFFDDEISAQEYVSVVLESDEKNTIVIEFDNYSDAAKWVRKPTDEEMQTLIATLVKNQDPRAKEYLKRFLDIEIESYKFKPKDWVLTRESSEDVWKLDIFSHVQWEESEGCYHYYCVGGWNYECIPYNDQTKHLIGTTDNWMNIQISRNPDTLRHL